MIELDRFAVVVCASRKDRIAESHYEHTSTTTRTSDLKHCVSVADYQELDVIPDDRSMPNDKEHVACEALVALVASKGLEQDRVD